MRISDWSSDVCSSDLVPVMHAAMHPILAEIEDERNQEGLQKQRQPREPGEFFPVERAPDRLDHHLVADIDIDQLEQRIAESDVKKVRTQLFPAQAPAVVARVHPFERKKTRLETDTDRHARRCLLDPLGRNV